jgi:hypothetical protein
MMTLLMLNKVPITVKPAINTYDSKPNHTMLISIDVMALCSNPSFRTSGIE